MDQESKSYDEQGTQVEIGDWENENNALETEEVGQQVAEEREFLNNENNIFFININYMLQEQSF